MLDAAIVGIGETAVGKQPGRTSLELQAEAIRLAVTDAGLTKSDIGAVYSLGSYIKPISQHAAAVAEYLGLQPSIHATIDVGGTPSFFAMIQAASISMKADGIFAAVCVYGDNAATRRAPGSHGFVSQADYGTGEFEEIYGQTTLSTYALLAQRYLYTYKLEARTAFAPVAIAMRKNASLNPNAAHRKEISLSEYLDSPIIADPLRKLDSSPLVDAAGAFVLVSRNSARERVWPRPAVSVLGAGFQLTNKIVSHVPDIPSLGMTLAAKRALKMSGVTLGEVDVVTIHDGFTVSVPLALEQIGFCKAGTGWTLAAEGALAFDGRLPTNTHGGLLSQGHVGGVLHLLEAVRQLRGDAGVRQVKGAKIALSAGVGGAFANCGVMIMGTGVSVADQE